MGDIQILQSAISERQRELHNTAEILARAAALQGRRASGAKVVTIVLGASVATQAVFEQAFPELGMGLVLVFSLIGFLIASVSGYEAAFNPSRKAAELNQLAAECHSNIWRIDSEWSKSVGTSYGDEQSQAARALLDQQDTAISEVQARASQNGVNITFQVRELYDGTPPALA